MLIFGLARFHSSSINQNGRETRGGTEIYGAPELKHHPPEHRLSSAYDIYSLGAVLAEVLCWVICGRECLGEFRKSRYATLPKLPYIVYRKEKKNKECTLISFRYKHTRHGTFFEEKGGKGDEIVMSLPVSRQLATMRHSISGLDSPLLEGLDRFFDIIMPCLEIDERKRPSAATVTSRMQDVHAILCADQNFHSSCGSCGNCCNCSTSGNCGNYGLLYFRGKCGVS